MSNEEAEVVDEVQEVKESDEQEPASEETAEEEKSAGDDNNKEESEKDDKKEEEEGEDEEESGEEGEESGEEGAEEDEEEEEEPPLPIPRGEAPPPPMPSGEAPHPPTSPAEPISPQEGITSPRSDTGMSPRIESGSTPVAFHHTDVTENEKEAVNESMKKWSIYGEEIKLIEVVRDAGEKKRTGLFGRSKKEEDFILSIGKHHMWIHTRDSPKKRSAELVEFHLLDVKSLMHNAQTRRMTITLKSGPVKTASLDYFLDENSKVLQVFLQSFKEISYGFPDNAIIIRSTDVLPDTESPAQTKYDRVLSNYLAQCSLARVSPSQELLYYLKNFFETNSIDLDFTCVPVIGNAGIAVSAAPGSDLNSSSVDDAEHRCCAASVAIPALCYEDVYRSLTIVNCCNVPSSRAVSHFVAQNHSITKLVVNRVCPNDGETATVINAISSSNALGSLELVDLSDNPIGPKAAPALFSWLRQWQHPLKELCLANCGLNPRTVPALCQGLSYNPRMSLTLEHLDLSGNKLDVLGSQALDSWFDTLKSYCKLRKLVLRDAGVVLSSMNTMRLLVELEEIDLSENKADISWNNLLETIMSNCPRLTKVSLSNCGLSYEVGFHSIINGLVARQKEGLFSLDVSHNPDIGKTLPRDAISSIAERLRALDISGLKFREQFFTDLLGSLASCSHMEHLNLSDACERVKSAGAPGVVQGLIPLTKIVKNLEIGDCYGKNVIVPFLEKIPTDTTVTRLNISNNSLGDVGAGALARTLCRIPTITSVNVDGNHIRLNGFLALATLFMDNETVSELSFTNDFQRELVSLSVPQDRKRLMEAITLIHCSLAVKEDRPLWFTNAQSRLDSPTPTRPSPLPEAPTLFKESVTDVAANFAVEPTATISAPPPAPPQPAQLSDDPNTSIKSFTNVPAAMPERSTTERFPANRAAGHKPIIASRVAARPAPSSTSPTKNRPPTLRAPPSFMTNTKSKSSSTLVTSETVPADGASAPVEDNAPVPVAQSGKPELIARRAGVAKRSPARRAAPALTSVSSKTLAVPRATVVDSPQKAPVKPAEGSDSEEEEEEEQPPQTPPRPAPAPAEPKVTVEPPPEEKNEGNSENEEKPKEEESDGEAPPPVSRDPPKSEPEPEPEPEAQPVPEAATESKKRRDSVSSSSSEHDHEHGHGHGHGHEHRKRRDSVDGSSDHEHRSRHNSTSEHRKRRDSVDHSSGHRSRHDSSSEHRSRRDSVHSSDHKKRRDSVDSPPPPPVPRDAPDAAAAADTPSSPKLVVKTGKKRLNLDL